MPYLTSSTTQNSIHVSHRTTVSILFPFAGESIVPFSHLDPLEREFTALQCCATNESKNVARHSPTTGGLE